MSTFHEDLWSDTDGWNSISKNESLPTLDFNISHIVDYFVNRNAIDGIPNNDFKSLNKKAYPLFKAGHLHSLIYKKCNSILFVKCKCKAEMKKVVEYAMRACIDDEGEILYAICGCPAGTGPLCSCKHFGALCYLIEEICRLKLTSTSEPQSCTDSLQTWHHPRQKRKLDCFHPMDSIKFIKNEYGKIKRNPSSSYDPRPAQYQQTTSNDIKSLQNNLKTLSTPVALLDVIPFYETPFCDSANAINLPLVPHSSQIRIQAAISNEPQPISLQCLFKYAKSFLEMINVSAEDALKIESCTREQSLKPRWFHERKCRLTSSNFGAFCKGAITTAKVKTLLYKESSKLSNSAIMWGKLHESTAFDQYRSIHSSKSGLILRKSGIFISNKDGFLAASPDGILFRGDEKCGLLEIKCPYSCRNLTVLEACNQVKAFCCEVVNNEIHL